MIWRKHTTEKEKPLDEAAAKAEDDSAKNTAQDEKPPFVIDKELLISPAISNAIDEDATYFSKLGIANGKLMTYQPDTIQEISELRARQIIERIRIIIKQQLANIKVEMDANKIKKSKIEKDWETAEKYYNEQHTYNNRNPKESSLFNVRLYLILAVVLLIADVPLTATLTRVVFGIGQAGPASGFMTAVISNLNIWLLAIGICSMSFILKIIYDEVMNTPLGNYVNQFKEIPGIINTDEVRATKIEYFIKLAFQLLIAFWIAYMVYYFGHLRATVLEDMFRRTKNMHFLADHIDEIQITIVSLTILIPLASGILFSKSNSNYLNHTRLKSKREAYDKATRELEEVSKELTGIQQRNNNLRDTSAGWLVTEENPEHPAQRIIEPIDYLKGIFIACYKYGFRIGVMEAGGFNAMSDQFGRAEFFKSRIDNFKLKKILNENIHE